MCAAAPTIGAARRARSWRARWRRQRWRSSARRSRLRSARHEPRSRHDRLHGQRRGGVGQRAAGDAAVVGAARRAASDRHQGRLRRRRLRRLHGAARRRAGLRLPGSGGGVSPAARCARSKASPTADCRRCRPHSWSTARRNAASARPACWSPARRCSNAIRGRREEEVRDALGGVLCRCTGYRKIIAAVMNASHHAGGARPPTARQRLGSRRVADPPRRHAEGDRHRQVSAPTAFLPMRCRCWSSARRTTARRSRFGDLDAFVAKHPGVVAVFTAADIPGRNRFGAIAAFADQPALAEGYVRFRGEAIAVISGERDAIADLAIRRLPRGMDAAAACACALRSDRRRRDAAASKPPRQCAGERRGRARRP